MTKEELEKALNLIKDKLMIKIYHYADEEEREEERWLVSNSSETLLTNSEYISLRNLLCRETPDLSDVFDSEWVVIPKSNLESLKSQITVLKEETKHDDKYEYVKGTLSTLTKYIRIERDLYGNGNDIYIGNEYICPLKCECGERIMSIKRMVAEENE